MYTKKAQATRQRILDAASELMLSKGFGRTKLDEVLLKARVRKGNFYYYFRGKEDLGLAVIKETAAPMTTAWVRGLVKPDLDPMNNLSNLTMTVAQSAIVATGKGNPVVNLAFEMCELAEDFRLAVAQSLLEVQSVYETEISRLLVNRGQNDPAKARELASYLVALIEGAVIMNRIHVDDEQLKRTLDVGLSVITGQVAAAVS